MTDTRWSSPPIAPPPSAQSQDGPHVGPVPSTNGLSIAGMVLGIVGLVFFGLLVIPSILAVIFGHRSVGTIRRTMQRGKGFAVAAIATGWVGLAIGALIWTVAIANGGRNTTCHTYTVDGSYHTICN